MTKTTKTNNIEQLFDESLNHVMVKEGAIIDATVVRIENSVVILDAQLKSEAFVPISQFDEEIEIGAITKVYLVTLDNGHGQLIVSREKAKMLEALTAMEQSMINSINVVGIVVKPVRGGYTVHLKNIKAFLPGSLAGVQISDEDIIDKVMEFKVLRVDHIRGNVVLSRKAVLEEHNLEERKRIIDTIKVGDVFSGMIKNITDFGAFVDIGGFDGLVHIADISWKRIKHPSEVLTIGQKIDVKALNFEHNKLSLGIKQIHNDPWSTIAENIKVGDIVEAKVTNITEYGCFMSIRDGIEGLVHSTEIDWQYRSVNPNKYCKVGDTLLVKVMDINIEKHRIALSIKECRENPWIAFSQKHKRHDIMQGRVVSITEFGIFLNLAPNVDGLVHISDVSYHNPEQEIAKYKTGDIIDVSLMSIDTKRQRITLGIKQIQVDKFGKFNTSHKIGDQVRTTITDILDSGGLKIIIDDFELEGLINKSNLPRNRKGGFNVGDQVLANITQIDRRKKIILLSIVESHEEREDNSNIIKSTVGDLIAAQLKAQIKELQDS